ncbi:hypothetical protein CPter291_1132 [Collimonas pratensis]|uniref:Uncharacterized protein n=1 Tax=Collimonas pratensis TaxID=279113 RepID=A0ABN4M6K5_9BURK|nr:hypothetical protein CPter291_1132 [Collimonas pratensis]
MQRLLPLQRLQQLPLLAVLKIPKKSKASVSYSKIAKLGSHWRTVHILPKLAALSRAA